VGGPFRAAAISFAWFGDGGVLAVGQATLPSYCVDGTGQPVVTIRLLGAGACTRLDAHIAQLARIQLAVSAQLVAHQRAVASGSSHYQQKHEKIPAHGLPPGSLLSVRLLPAVRPELH
jgi:hypothetical protein